MAARLVDELVSVEAFSFEVVFVDEEAGVEVDAGSEVGFVVHG